MAKTNDIIYLEKIPLNLRGRFKEKLIHICVEMRFHPNWMMNLFKAETAGTFSPSIQNPLSKATGLIQFMPSTAKALGTTIDRLKLMDHVQQLDYVRLYFLPYKNRCKSYYDLYAVTFFPAAVGKPDDWILKGKNLSATAVYNGQRFMDVNGDKQISVGEFKRYVNRTISPAYFDAVVNSKASKDYSVYMALALGLLACFSLFRV